MAEGTSARVERGIKLFNSGYNCAQATLCAFAEDIGIDERELRLAAAALGGGMSGTRGVCGAVSGMLIALGFLRASADVTDTERKHALYAEGRELIDDFTAEFGTVTCGELMASAARFRKEPHPLVNDPMCRPCSAYVAYAVSILEAHLNCKL